MPWGVPVPGDEAHVMYVWFDALVNYISCLGWPAETDKFHQFWGTADQPNAIQIAGKDNLRQQSAMWQAMLIAANLPTSRQIVIHGFITSGGQKMSKSLGNVINPLDLVNQYGPDAVRFFIAHDLNPFEDSDVTPERIQESYTANLVNGLGNLVARITQLSQTYLEHGARPEPVGFPSEYTDALQTYQFNQAIQYIFDQVEQLDKQITDQEPFKLVKTDPESGKQLIFELTQKLYTIARLLQPFMPQTSDAIKQAVVTNTKPAPLFPRL